MQKLERVGLSATNENFCIVGGALFGKKIIWIFSFGLTE